MQAAPSKARAPATPPKIGRTEEDEEEGEGERRSHVAAPFSDVLPSGQSSQADLLVAPASLEDFPAEQSVQGPPFCPNLPAVQGTRPHVYENAGSVIVELAWG